MSDDQQDEARHSSLMNIFSNGDAIPQAFDSKCFLSISTPAYHVLVALTPPEVLGLIGGFLFVFNFDGIRLTCKQRELRRL